MVYASGLGPGGGNPVEVRVLSHAPERLINMGWREEASERSRKIQKSISENEKARFKSRIVEVLKELGVSIPLEISTEQEE